MTATLEAPASDQTERIAERLLKASKARSWDPDTEVDWDAEPVAGRFYMPERLVTLYGTPLWDTLSLDQKIELSKHEVSSIAAAGIWFELILDQMLIRHIYTQDPTTSHVRYALTEIEDECRHSKMFARLIETLGTPVYGPPPAIRSVGTLLKTRARGVEAFAATLIIEEVLDAGQRELARDESVQPVVRQVCGIHVAEEARHLSFARGELEREVPKLGRIHLEVARIYCAIVARLASRNMVSSQVYAAIGLDPKGTAKVVRSSKARVETEAELAKRLVRFLSDVDLIGGPSAPLWKLGGIELPARPRR
ncbi:MAG TPA: diiron oxygenase [Mycobacteriales bacterium]|nr:diiron oxygenase [Mycobacteriales bacterium]